MTPLALAALRLHAQRLAGNPLATAPEVVGWLGAVQAQDFAGAKWAIAQRAPGLDDAALDALFDAGRLLRLHVLRPTWHLVRAEDVRWLLALSRDRVAAAMASYDRKLEIDDALVARSHAALAAALDGGRHLTRAAISDALARAGIAARGPRLAHLMMRAELDAVVVSGPRSGKHHTYALFDARVPPSPPRPRDEALADLARRYFASHGPATVYDFAWWSGLTVTEARAGRDGLGADLETATADGALYSWVPPEARLSLPAPCVHLLPNYDEHVVAYRNHGPSLDPGAPRALDGWGTARTTHLAVRDGLVVGGWRRTVARDLVTVRLTVPVRLTPAEDGALAAAAAAYGLFLGQPVVMAAAC